MLAVEFSPDGAELASASADGTVRLWAAPAPPLRVLDASAAASAAAVAAVAATDQSLAVLRGHTDSVRGGRRGLHIVEGRERGEGEREREREREEEEEEEDRRERG